MDYINTPIKIIIRNKNKLINKKEYLNLESIIKINFYKQFNYNYSSYNGSKFNYYSKLLLSLKLSVKAFSYSLFLRLIKVIFFYLTINGQ